MTADPQSASANQNGFDRARIGEKEPARMRRATAVVYCEANFGAIDGKTANGLVRDW